VYILLTDYPPKGAAHIPTVTHKSHIRGWTGMRVAPPTQHTHTHTLAAHGSKALPPFPRDRFPGG
jgi:hypothetical protein